MRRVPPPPTRKHSEVTRKYVSDVASLVILRHHAHVTRYNFISNVSPFSLLIYQSVLMLSIEVLGDVLTSNEREDELEKVLKMFPNDRGWVFLFSFIFFGHFHFIGPFHCHAYTYFDHFLMLLVFCSLFACLFVVCWRTIASEEHHCAEYFRRASGGILPTHRATLFTRTQSHTGLEKNQNPSLLFGSLHFSSTSLELFWTGPQSMAKRAMKTGDHGCLSGKLPTQSAWPTWKSASPRL